MGLQYQDSRDYWKKYSGSLQKVVITQGLSGNNSAGFIEDKGVIIINGQGCLASECLVRLDHRLNTSKRFGKMFPIVSWFITSEVPRDFEAVSKSNYFLCGLWDETMGDKYTVPNKKQIYDYFDVGIIYDFLYFQEDSSNDKGRFISREFRARRVKNSLPRTLRDYASYLNKPRHEKYPKVLLVQSRNKLEQAMEKIEEIGLVPIEMQPLRKNLRQALNS